MTDRDLVELFGRLERPIEPDPRFVDDLLRRVEAVLTDHVDQTELKELDMPQLIESRTSRRWLLPAIGVAAALVVAVLVFATRSSDDKSQVNTSPTTTVDPIAAYSAQLHDAYGPYYSKLNLYFSTCQLGITTIDFVACGRSIDAAITAVNTFETTMSTLQPPAALADDQRKILSADPAILEILRQSKVAADAQDVQSLQAINPTFQAAYTVSCDALKHYNSLTAGDDHLRTDLGPGCPD